MNRQVLGSLSLRSLTPQTGLSSEQSIYKNRCIFKNKDGSANIFCEEPDSKYYRVCHVVSVTHSLLFL